MKVNLEYRYVPVQVRKDDDGNTVATGTVIRYGDRATLPWFTEEFRAGWVQNSSDLMFANRMHNRDEPLAVSDGDLTITDGSERMTAELVLPATTHGSDAAIELDKGLLRGFSLEFLTTKDEYDYDEDHRIVVEGRMFGFSVVDRPAYPDSVAKMKRWQEYRQHYGLWTPEPNPPAEPEITPASEIPATAYRVVV